MGGTQFSFPAENHGGLTRLNLLYGFGLGRIGLGVKGLGLGDLGYGVNLVKFDWWAHVGTYMATLFGVRLLYIQLPRTMSGLQASPGIIS